MNPAQSQPVNLSPRSVLTGETRFNAGQKVALFIACISVLTTLGTGCSTESPEVITAVPTESTAKAPATIATPELGTDQYAEAVKKYKVMDIESFNALPRDERLLYSEYLVDQTQERGTYSGVYNYSKPGEEFMITPAEISRNNNGQEIVDSNLFRLQMVFLQFIEGESKPYDADDGKKMLSSVYYTVSGTTTQAYITSVSTADTLENPAKLDEKLNATNTSDLMMGKDADGNTVEFKDVTHNTSDVRTVYARNVYHEFTNYRGSRSAIWLTDSISSSPANIEVDSTISSR